ncbi:MAG: DUF885 family protein [Opitutae bacterium]|nr:DUF885 family protein [Opitutae bacterium]
MQALRRASVAAALCLLALGVPLPAAPTAAEDLVSAYLERWAEFYPSQATAAGRTDFDRQLENIDEASVARWLRFGAAIADGGRQLAASPALSRDDRIDLDVLLNAIARERLTLRTRAVWQRDPLFWTDLAANAAIYLLLRDDQPRPERIAALEARAAALPRLLAQAERALGPTPRDRLAPELVRPAAQQAKSLVRLYRSGLGEFAAAAPEAQRKSLAAAGDAAAAALERFGAFLDRLAGEARGSARLGADYAETFRLYLRTGEKPADLLPRFERDLAALRREVAAYGRQVWPQLRPAEALPADDTALIRRLFALVEAQHDTAVAAYVRFWQELPPQLEAFARERGVVTLPGPRTLKILPAPNFLLGQAFGGVFPAGPYRPDGQTLLLLPVPGAETDAAGRAKFFRAFNRPFSRMIAAHEALPGHYVQLKTAAHQAHEVRAIFPDQVYAEGWGTFAERLMLEAGWGGPLEWLAHYKKQLENCTRAIVDIRVQTTDVSRAEIARFVREEGLQDGQLGENLWFRTLTSAPQLVTYHVGYGEIRALYRDARARAGDRFDLRAFNDWLLSRGAIPLHYYREEMAASAATPRAGAGAPPPPNETP